VDSGVEESSGAGGRDEGSAAGDATGSASGELQRRLVHASGSLVPLSYVAGFLDWRIVQGIFVFGTAVALVLETIRLFVGLDWAIYDRLTREYEQENPAGYALYAVSMAIVSVAFSPHVALPGMLMLAIGDPISGLLGSRSAGEIKRPPTLLAMFCVSFALAAPFLVAPALDLAPPRGSVVLPLAVGVPAAVLGAAGATLADGIKPVIAGYVIDDNFSIPPVACVLIWGTLAALP